MEGIFEQAERNNQEHWDELAPVHAKAYPEIDILRAGGIVLDEIELQEIGDVKGKTLLHLQCHIGTDTLSWARQGARVTGVDFSGESIARAKNLQQELGLEADFVQANIYDLRTTLTGQFDIVYTSRGVLCWLRDLDEWARIIAHFLKPGGIFYLMESHPFLNMYEETKPGELEIVYTYFHQEEPTLWEADGPDYADESYVSQTPSYEWEWSIGDIVNALLKAGLVLESFNEYDRLFFKYFPSMESCMERWYHLPQHAGKLPLLFTLRARKPGSDEPDLE